MIDEVHRKPGVGMREGRRWPAKREEVNPLWASVRRLPFDASRTCVNGLTSHGRKMVWCLGGAGEDEEEG